MRQVHKDWKEAGFYLRGTRRIERFARQASSTEVDSAIGATYMLGGLGGREAAGALLSLLASNPDFPYPGDGYPISRGHVLVGALHDVDTLAAGDALLSLLDRDDPALREDVFARLLDCSGDVRLFPRLRHSPTGQDDATVRRLIFEAFAKNPGCAQNSGSRGLTDPLVHIVHRPGRRPRETRNSAAGHQIRSFLARSPPPPPQGVASLRSRPRQAGWGFCEVLIFDLRFGTRDVRALPVAEELCRDAEHPLSAVAREALDHLGITPAQDPLHPAWIWWISDGIDLDWSRLPDLELDDFLPRTASERDCWPLLDKDWSSPEHAAAALRLARLGTPEARWHLLLHCEVSPAIRWALGRVCGEDWAEEALAVLRRPDSSLADPVSERFGLDRSGASWIAGIAGDERAVDPLLRWLDDRTWEKKPENWSEVNATSWALAQLRVAAAVKSLSRVLHDHEKDLARAGAAKALGRIGTAAVVKPLCEALEDWHWAVRHAALEALGATGDRRAVKPVMAWLRQREYLEVDRVAGLLRAHPVPGLVETLHRQLADPRVNRVAAATSALVEIGDRLAGRAVASLTRHDSLRVRHHALQELGRLARLHTIDVKEIARLLREELVKGTIPYLRHAAARGLGWLGDPEAVPDLVRADRETPVLGYAVASALAEIGGPEASRWLLRAQSDPRRWVRWIALAHRRPPPGAALARYGLSGVHRQTVE